MITAAIASNADAKNEDVPLKIRFLITIKFRELDSRCSLISWILWND